GRLALPGLAAIALAVNAWCVAPPRRATESLVPRMAERGYSVIPYHGGLFFCREPRTHEQLNRLAKDPRHVGDWAGIAFGQRMDPESRGQSLDVYGDCGAVVGEYVFFGAPDVLAEARVALGR